MMRKSPEKPQNNAGSPDSGKDADTKSLEADLSASLKMPVVITHDASGNGALTIKYDSLDDLDALCRALSLLDLSKV
jgi:ParB family chromosome partitioning protein